MGTPGTLVPSLAVGAVADLAGNQSAGSESTDGSVTYDTVAPTVTINQASSQGDPTRWLPIVFEVVFSKPINASTFTAAALTQHGTASAVTWTVVDSGAHTHFTVSAIAVGGAGTLVPSLATGAVSDQAGNGNAASTSTDDSVTYDDVVPAVAINRASTQADPTNAFPVYFSVVFSKAIAPASFTTGDITQSGTASGATWSLSDSGDHTTFVLSATGATSYGTLRPTLAEGVVQDALGNGSAASIGAHGSVTYSTPPSLQFQVGTGSPTPPSPDPYGTVSANTSHTYTLKNLGGTPSSAIAVTLTGSYPTKWSKETDACSGALLGPGATCQLQLTFLGGTSATGSYSATLQAHASSGGTTTHTLTASVSCPVSTTRVEGDYYQTYESDYQVPGGCTSVTVKAWGGGGGHAYGPSALTFSGAGGGGGFAKAVVAVSPGELLRVWSGRGGSVGFNGGWQGDAGGGGGLSTVTRTDYSTILVAGGGGGAGGQGFAIVGNDTYFAGSLGGNGGAGSGSTAGGSGGAGVGAYHGGAGTAGSSTAGAGGAAALGPGSYAAGPGGAGDTQGFTGGYAQGLGQGGGSGGTRGEAYSADYSVWLTGGIGGGGGDGYHGAGGGGGGGTFPSLANGVAGSTDRGSRAFGGGGGGGGSGFMATAGVTSPQRLTGTGTAPGGATDPDYLSPTGVGSSGIWDSSVRYATCCANPGAIVIHTP